VCDVEYRSAIVVPPLNPLGNIRLLFEAGSRPLRRWAASLLMVARPPTSEGVNPRLVPGRPACRVYRIVHRSSVASLMARARGDTNAGPGGPLNCNRVGGGGGFRGVDRRTVRTALWPPTLIAALRLSYKQGCSCGRRRRPVWLRVTA